MQSQLISKQHHSIDRQKISPVAIETVAKLQQAGFQAYIVGGCVRDLLLNLEPKDFDVATDATPEQVNGLFKRSQMIGRRFRLVHVRKGREIVEVSTFRGNEANADQDLRQEDVHGRLIRDNSYGSLEEDAVRRDFTVNALYYDPTKEVILDHVGGMQDIARRKLCLMGDPTTRYREDPVRILRALRFAAKLDFDIDAATSGPIIGLSSLLDGVPAARLYDETIKMFHSGHASKIFEMMEHFQVLEHLFPAAVDALTVYQSQADREMIYLALSNTDQRIGCGKSVTPAFLFAFILWPAVRQRAEFLEKTGAPTMPAWQQASYEIEMDQMDKTAVPRRLRGGMRDIWLMQSRFERRAGQRAFKLLTHPRFRAAYDFLVLRAATGQESQELADWWTTFQTLEIADRKKAVNALTGSKSGPKRRRAKPAKK